MNTLLELSAADLNALADALASGRLTLPVNTFSLQRVLGRAPAPALAEALSQLAKEGVAGALRLLASPRRDTHPPPELVWTGPDESQVLRSTSTVVEDLIRTAKHRIVLAGFAITNGAAVFGALAQRMDAEPDLQVELFLNVHRRKGARPEETIVWFARDFRERVWPGRRLPVAWYDPRSVKTRASERAVLHAKCVVIDGQQALVTSANFTPHAQERNIELGVRLEDASLAVAIETQFADLVQRGHLARLPGF